MRFEWDEEKNRINQLKHGINFRDVPTMFEHPSVVNVDKRDNYGEDRFIMLGILRSATIAVIVYVERKNGIYRIISARKATKNEQRFYRENT